MSQRNIKSFFARPTVFLCAILAGLLMLSAASFAAPGEEEYIQADTLLREGRLDDALAAFKKLEGEPIADEMKQKVKIGALHTAIEQARMLKERNDAAWERNVYAVYDNLNILLRSNQSSPEIYLVFAKSYWLNNRVGKAEKSLKKAFFYKPAYAEAYIFQGDMYFAEAVKAGPGSETYLDYIVKARKSFEQALAGAGEMSGNMKARIHFNIGEAYYINGEKRRAKEAWANAAAIASENPWVKKAQDRLGAVQ